MFARVFAVGCRVLPKWLPRASSEASAPDSSPSCRARTGLVRRPSDSFTSVTPTDQRVQVPPNCDLTLGMVCLDKSEPGRTVWRMMAEERFANPTGIIQGGFLAAFADSSMGASALTFARERKVFAANAELKVSFLKPVPAGATLTS